MQLEKILFLDVETVSQTELYSELSEDQAALWQDKFIQIKNRAPEKYSDDSNAENSLSDMALFAEFGRIVCISMGFLYKEENEWHIRVKSIYGDHEEKILQEFATILRKLYARNYLLCGHNIREFDVPYIARRMIINNIQLPQLILNAQRKKWESPVIDTMEMWKFGDYKHFTTLKLLCNILHIPSPKNDMEGHDVYRVFYQEKNLERISTYCQNDVVATIQVFLKLSGFQTIAEDKIEYLHTQPFLV